MARLLLVEDDLLLARMFRRVFSRLGYDVLVAEDGKKALLVALEMRPELVILDAILPGLHGFFVLRALKSNQVTNSSLVIMVTNLALEKKREEAYQLGAAMYVIKNDFDPLIVGRLIHTFAQSHKHYG